jgi:hypothetical protein
VTTVDNHPDARDVSVAASSREAWEREASEEKERQRRENERAYFDTLRALAGVVIAALIVVPVAVAQAFLVDVGVESVEDGAAWVIFFGGMLLLFAAGVILTIRRVVGHPRRADLVTGLLGFGLVAPLVVLPVLVGLKSSVAVNLGGWTTGALLVTPSILLVWSAVSRSPRGQA